MADKKQGELTTALGAWGLWSHKFTDAHWGDKDKEKSLVLPFEAGKADTIFIRPPDENRSRDVGFVEVKNGKAATDYGSFMLDEWRENQRRWAEFVEDMGIGLYWIFLVLGPDRANVRGWNRDADGNLTPNLNPKTGKQYKPKKAWLVPRTVMVYVDELVRSCDQTTLPYFAGKGYNIKMQTEGIDAVRLLKDYALEWSNGGWSLPRNHQFFHIYQPPMSPENDMRKMWNDYNSQEKMRCHRKPSSFLMPPSQT